MVVFRLTEEEYASLREACRSRGGRNLSDFTRSELLAILQSESMAALVQKRFRDLELKLDDAVAQLTELLAQGSADRRHSQAGGNSRNGLTP
jgi:predicted transcriptional regulator